MSIILKHIIRNIKEHKMRSILIFLALLISTCVLIIDIVLPDELFVKIEDTYKIIYGNTDIHINTVDDFTINDLKVNDIEFDYIGINTINAENSNKKAINISKEKKVIDDTKPGDKKNLDKFPDNYDPSYVESAWNAWWQKENFFKVDLQEGKNKPRDKRFIMLLPPPNVTGSLHLGHAMMGAIEDTIIRYKRLKGYTSLWVPGVDHAGIATQSVVEKKILKDEGK